MMMMMMMMVMMYFWCCLLVAGSPELIQTLDDVVLGRRVVEGGVLFPT